MKVSQGLLTAALAMVLHLAGWGQSLRFDLRMGEEPLELDAEKPSATNVGVTVEAFRFYVSDVALVQGERVLAELPERHHLVDAEVPESWVFALGAKGIPEGCDGIRFALGIDSLTNVSGALGGDLDPTRGMYWAWQSGYINLKIEGTSPVCPARNHRFQFHLGGYAAAMNALQMVRLPIRPGSQDIVVEVDCGQMLRQIDLTKEYEVMSPSLRAVELSQLAVGMFRVAP